MAEKGPRKVKEALRAFDAAKRRGKTDFADEAMAKLLRDRQKRAARNRVGAGLGKSMLGGFVAGTAIATGVNAVAANERARRQRALRGAEEVKRRRAAKAGFRTDFKRGPNLGEGRSRKTRQERASRARTSRPVRAATVQTQVPARRGLRAPVDAVPKAFTRMNERLNKVESLTPRKALPMLRVPL